MNYDIIILHYIALYITLYYIILHYITLYYIILHYITLYYIILHYILHYITLYHIILHYISYTLFYHVIWLSSQSYPTIKPFCGSFGRKLRPTTNPPSQQPGNATWKTIAAVPRFSFFFESDRNRSFGRRFDTTTEIFWMLVSEVEEATTKKCLEFVFFWRETFFLKCSFAWKECYCKQICLAFFWGGQDIAHAGAPNISRRTIWMKPPLSKGHSSMLPKNIRFAKHLGDKNPKNHPV